MLCKVSHLSLLSDFLISEAKLTYNFNSEYPADISRRQYLVKLFSTFIGLNRKFTEWCGGDPSVIFSTGQVHGRISLLHELSTSRDVVSYEFLWKTLRYTNKKSQKFTQ